MANLTYRKPINRMKDYKDQIISVENIIEYWERYIEIRGFYAQEILKHQKEICQINRETIIRSSNWDITSMILKFLETALNSGKKKNFLQAILFDQNRKSIIKDNEIFILIRYKECIFSLYFKLIDFFSPFDLFYIKACHFIMCGRELYQYDFFISKNAINEKKIKRMKIVFK